MPETIYLYIFAISSILSIGFAAWAYKKYDVRGASAFAYSFLGIGIWSLNSFLRVLADTVFLTNLLLTTGVTSVIFSAYFWYKFAEQYTGRPNYKLPRYIGVVLFISAIVLGASNIQHQLVWQSITPISSNGFKTFEITKEIGHYIFTLSSYGFYFVGVYYLFDLFSSARHTSGIAFIILSPLALIGINLSPYLVTLEITHATTITPLGATLALSFAALSVERKLLDIQPIAREDIFKKLADPLLVINEHKQVIDYNEAFKQQFCEPQVSDDYTAEFPELNEQVNLNSDRLTETTLRINNGKQIFKAKSSPLKFGTELTGYAIQLRDITELERSHREVERHNTHLKDFSDSAAHELKNPLTVIKGHSEIIANTLAASSDPNTQLQDSAEIINERATHMSNILEDFEKAISAAQSIDKVEPLELQNLLTEARQDINSSNIQIETPVSGVLYADKQRATLLLKTILRFFDHTTPEDQETTRITAELTENGFIINSNYCTIQDGIGDDLLQHSYSKEHGISGLGLSIAKTLAETHYWKIEFHPSQRNAKLIITGARTERGPEIESTEPIESSILTKENNKY